MAGTQLKFVILIFILTWIVLVCHLANSDKIYPVAQVENFQLSNLKSPAELLYELSDRVRRDTANISESSSSKPTHFTDITEDESSPHFSENATASGDLFLTNTLQTNSTLATPEQLFSTNTLQTNSTLATPEQLFSTNTLQTNSTLATPEQLFSTNTLQTNSTLATPEQLFSTNTLQTNSTLSTPEQLASESAGNSSNRPASNGLSTMLAQLVQTQSQPFERPKRTIKPFKFPDYKKIVHKPSTPSPPNEKETTTVDFNEYMAGNLPMNTEITSPSIRSSTNLNTIVTNVHCYQIQCGTEQGLSVTLFSEPIVVPWGTNITLECNVIVPANTNFTVWWTRQYSTSYKPRDRNAPIEFLEEEIVPAAGIENETVLLTSVLNRYDVSSTDSGYYTCSIQLMSHCCHVNATRQVIAFHPPHHNADLIIVVCVCILQALAILFVYTKSRQASSKEPKIKDIPLQTFQYKPIKNLSSIEEGDDHENESDEDNNEYQSKA